MSTLRLQAQAILLEAGWDIPLPDLSWSPRLSRCAGLFVLSRDRRGCPHPEIRLSVPLLRRRDRSWPVQACGTWCQDPSQLLRRVLEHELIHYHLWHAGEKDWGHTGRFRRIALESFGHQAITHAIGAGGGGTSPS
nr:hypothetical protein [uncultured Holophaga sp.]